MLTIAAATAALDVPSAVANNNCVQSGQARLREKLNLAGKFYKPEDEAPDYVVRAVEGLQSWIDHAANRP